MNAKQTALDAYLARTAAIDAKLERLQQLADDHFACPVCGHVKTERMPTDACQWFYECDGCHTVFKPKPGHCCVSCSYGTVPCPPIQISGKSCCA